ncbi:hypothetical protein GCM10029992_26810 [Glycomyces albus]
MVFRLVAISVRSGAARMYQVWTAGETRPYPRPHRIRTAAAETVSPTVRAIRSIATAMAVDRPMRVPRSRFPIRAPAAKVAASAAMP